MQARAKIQSNKLVVDIGIAARAVRAGVTVMRSAIKRIGDKDKATSENLLRFSRAAHRLASKLELLAEEKKKVQ
jgi:hypothetical protein